MPLLQRLRKTMPRRDASFRERFGVIRRGFCWIFSCSRSPRRSERCLWSLPALSRDSSSRDPRQSVGRAGRSADSRLGIPRHRPGGNRAHPRRVPLDKVLFRPYLLAYIVSTQRMRLCLPRTWRPASQSGSFLRFGSWSAAYAFLWGGPGISSPTSRGAGNKEIHPASAKVVCSNS